MTPKEKAEELIEKMHKCMFSDGQYDATQCAIIAVEEIIELNVDWNDDGGMKAHHCGIESTQGFWEEVLTHLKQIQ